MQTPTRDPLPPPVADRLYSCAWRQDGDLFTEDGKPRPAQEPTTSSSSWRGPNGLYCVGFSGRGLLGAGADALRAAADIAGRWQAAAAAGGGASSKISISSASV